MRQRLATFRGLVIEARPNTEFMVQVTRPDSETNPNVIRCQLNGKMRKHRIYVRVGDKVEFEIPEHSEVGRIFKRLNV